MQATEFSAPQQADLVARTKAGDRRAFAEIYDDTFDNVYRYAMALTRSRQDAEDVTAETYERALRAIHRYSSRDVPIQVWLIRIARNVARERLAKVRRECPMGEWEERLGEMASPAVFQEQAPPWEMLLQQLPPAQREVIALRLAGLRGREIAQSLGKAEGTIKALQFAAIRNLRKTVQR